MSFVEFYPYLTYKRKNLFTAADVVQHSFMVQKSILNLNLELTQSYELRNGTHARNYLPSFSYSKDMIHTKEKCHKIHENRNILYKLNLDMPETREESVLFDSKKIGIHHGNSRRRYLIPIIQLHIRDSFYADLLFKFVEYAFNNNYDKIKILTWLLNFKAIIPSELQRLPHSIVSCIADCLYPGLMDTEFAIKSLKMVNYTNWIPSNDGPERVANILYQVRRLEKNKIIISWCDQFILKCIFDVSFQNISAILKFLDTLIFCHSFKEFLFLELVFEFGELSDDWQLLPVTATVDKRYLLLLLTLWFHVQSWRNPSAAIDAVRIIWNSVPDPLINNKEMVEAYEKIGLNSEEIEGVYDFYCQAVGKADLPAEPRSLQHYCRITIRKAVYDNNWWLPEGIGRIGLPPLLQSFLNLQS